MIRKSVEEEFILRAHVGLSILLYFFPTLTSILAARIENWIYFVVLRGLVSLILLNRVQLWLGDTVGAQGMTYQQWGKLHYILVFLYELQQNLPGYLFTFSSVNRCVWSTRFPSQCNACSRTWLTSAATNDSVTSTSHDAWNTSLHFCLCCSFHSVSSVGFRGAKGGW